jgi:hypothetical protein
MPTNPNSKISFESDNSVAPVMTVSRTMQSMKARRYMNLYQVNKVMGNFTGMASMNLTDQQQTRSGNNRLSMDQKRDALSCHFDYRDFYRYLPKTDKCVGKDAIEMALSEMAWLYSNGMDEFEEQHQKEATYVQLEDIVSIEVTIFVSIEVTMKTSNEQSVRVFENENDQQGKVITFISKWPRLLIPIFHSGLQYGQDFVTTSGF